jgi:Tol biopolymer transport system component
MMFSGGESTMNVKPGARLGPYEVLTPLGAGGMGEVWRARDTRLGRQVALKFLPEELAEDPERHARFEREAKVLASLNHPNIAVLYGLEHVEGRHALVMELVEGEGLDGWIGRGPLPVGDAVAIALQLAEALEAAHEKGIVHRDLKPANVKVRPDGVVKVLDFGLARAWDEPVGGGDPAQSPTLTGLYTRAGMILGTAAYMSPEQARGKPVDKRADIWAFGCVLYEMLTGTGAFRGDTVPDVLAGIMTREPDWGALPAGLAAPMRTVLRRCLEKDPKERLRDIGDVRLGCEETGRPGEVGTATPPVAQLASAQPRRPPWVPWAVASGALIVAVAFAIAYARSASVRPRAVRSYILQGGETSFAFNGATDCAVLSPDGSRLAFLASDEAGKRRLWIRPLDSLTAQPLEGTDDASYPFWSPDSRFVGFFVPGKLKKIDTAGGRALTLCDAPSGRGGAWSPEDVIVFAPALSGGLRRVSSAGGDSVVLTTPDASRGQTSQRWPAFLPDGRHFMYLAGNFASSSRGAGAIYVAAVDGGESRMLVQADSDALYAPPGYILYLRDQNLVGQPFDAARLKLMGQAFPIAEEVASPEDYRLGSFSVSMDGTLVYATRQSVRMQTVWLDATGAQVGTVGEPVNGVGSFRLSPNGQMLAEPVQDLQTKKADIWLINLGRGVGTRFTFDAADDEYPVWSPDGSRIVWSSNRRGHLDLYAKSASGAGKAEALFVSDADKSVTDWSPDGRFIAFDQYGGSGKTDYDLWILPMFGDRKPYALLASPFDEGNGRFSPDGRWLAYESDESGNDEVYITSFPQVSGKWQVSQGGGTTASWRADGRAVYYATLEGKLMEAAVVARGAAVEIGTPHEFSKARLPARGVGDWEYALKPKGDRILALHVETAAPVPLTLVMNWTAGLKE